MIFSNRFEKYLRMLTDTTLNILQRNDSRKKRREGGKERRGKEKERKRKKMLSGVPSGSQAMHPKPLGLLVNVCYLTKGNVGK